MSYKSSIQTFPSWYMFFFSYSKYFINFGFVLYILMNSMFENNYPTNGNNSSPAFVACNANTPHPMYGCGYTLTSHFTFQYVKKMSFKIAHGHHCPSEVIVLELSTNLCWSLNELGYLSLWSGRVVEIIACKKNNCCSLHKISSHFLHVWMQHNKLRTIRIDIAHKRKKNIY